MKLIDMIISSTLCYLVALRPELATEGDEQSAASRRGAVAPLDELDRQHDDTVDDSDVLGFEAIERETAALRPGVERL